MKFGLFLCLVYFVVSNLSVKSGKIFDQLRAGFFHALRRFQNFRVRQIFPADARRQIRDARNARNAQAALPRDNGFRHRAHADRVRAERGERTDFRWRFIGRPAHGQINAALQFQFGNFPGAEQNLAQFFVVSFRQIHETRQPRNRRAAQRIGAHEIDVVGQNHEIARAEIFIDAARRVRQKQIGDAEGRQRARGKRDAFHFVAFVKMRAAAQN